MSPFSIRPFPLSSLSYHHTSQWSGGDSSSWGDKYSSPHHLVQKLQERASPLFRESKEPCPILHSLVGFVSRRFHEIYYMMKMLFQLTGTISIRKLRIQEVALIRCVRLMITQFRCLGALKLLTHRPQPFSLDQRLWRILCLVVGERVKIWGGATPTPNRTIWEEKNKHTLLLNKPSHQIDKRE